MMAMDMHMLLAKTINKMINMRSINVPIIPGEGTEGDKDKEIKKIMHTMYVYVLQHLLSVSVSLSLSLSVSPITSHVSF